MRKSINSLVKSINERDGKSSIFIIKNVCNNNILYLDITDQLFFWIQSDIRLNRIINDRIELENGLSWNDSARSGQYKTLFKGEVDPGVSEESIAELIKEYEYFEIEYSDLTLRDVLDCRISLNEISSELAIELLLKKLNSGIIQNNEFRYDKFFLNIFRFNPELKLNDDTDRIVELLWSESELIRNNFSNPFKEEPKMGLISKLLNLF